MKFAGLTAMVLLVGCDAGELPKPPTPRMFPKKGTIAPGSDADIVIFDPKKKTTLSAKTHHMKVDYNPYEGRQVTGVTETVLSRGKVIIDGGKFTRKTGAGSFLKRDPRSI